MLKRKQKITFVLTASLLSVITACSNQPTAPSAGAAKPTESGKSTEAAKLPETIKMMYTKGGFEAAPKGNPIKDEIEKGSGVKFEQISPPSANYAEQLHITMASGDVPDVVMMPTREDVFKYADQGALLDLTPYLNLMPDVKKEIPQAALDYFTVNGKLWSIPVWTSQHRYNFVIRGDWLKKLNLQAPKTLDELHDVLKAFVEKDPDGNGAKDTYGISGQGLEGLDPIFAAFGVIVGDAPWVTDTHASVYFTEQNGKLVPQSTRPEAKEALKLLASWYAEGLIDPEFVSQNGSVYDDKMVKNRYGATTHWWAWEPQREAAMKKVDPNAELIRIAPPIGPRGESGVRGVDLVARGVVVMKNTKHPEASAKFMNYFHTEKGMMTSYTGVEGIHWQNKDGKYLTMPQFDQDNKWIQWYSLFENEPPLLKVETYLAQSRRDALKWKVITNATDGMLTKSELKYSADLRALIADYFCRIISGKAPLSEFDNFVKEFNKRGGQEWTDEVNNLYQQKKK